MSAESNKYKAFRRICARFCLFPCASRRICARFFARFCAFIFALIIAPIALNADEIKSKLVYITDEVQNQSELRYVGEIMEVKYSVLVLEGAQVRSIGFVEGAGVKIQNNDQSFETTDDGRLEKIVYFKILEKNFSLPRLEVIVEGAESSDVSISKEALGNAISLFPNHPNFSAVVAKSLKIRNKSVRQYDEKNNIILLEIDAEMGNLEDFKLAGIKRQGFENFNSIITRSNGLFYAIVSNQIPALEFEYFDLSAQTYKQERVKNVANSANIAINQEIAPINKVLVFKNITILFISLALFVAFFIRKIPLKIRIAMFVVGILLLLFVVISVNDKERGVITQDSYARILPTTNSTIIAKIPANTAVQIISKHNDYVKILTPDNKTGWVEKEGIK